jgi:hypothetical protein
MTKHTLILDEGELELDPDATYTVYGEVLFAVDIIALDLEHLPWLDQITILQELDNFYDISIMYHPEVVASIYELYEASPYWGKNRHDCESMFRRLQTSKVTDEKQDRKLLKPVEWTPTMRSKKGKVTSRLVEMGYDRVHIRETFNQFLQDKGEGYMNLTVNQIADKVDEYARDVSDESEGKYISTDSQKPCDLYLLEFTNKSTGECFIKPGITRRTLAERYSQDKERYDIKVLHTVSYPTSKCVILEKEIQKRWGGKYRYVPTTKLQNNGTTEIMSMELPINEVIELMGNNKVL